MAQFCTANPMRHLLPLCLLSAMLLQSGEASPSIYLDEAKVLRWLGDGSELALFGANYSLASASDYRAAGYLGADRRELVDQDFAHFRRMGWNALRISFWGDYENSDAAGNLAINDHLDLLGYILHQAHEHGLGILFSPITNHSSLWPDGPRGSVAPGFGAAFPKEQLGRDPVAIAAQANYLSQLFEYVNPHTGRAIKDEPAILFVELINEPWHHSKDFDGSVDYINSLAAAVRSTGCEKLLVHNLSQDFGIASAIRASAAVAGTIGWYPSGLVNRRTLQGNFLRTVDAYTPLLKDDFKDFPTLVYEYDPADLADPTMHPAMIRSFRTAGVQFAAMFSYDMLATAPYNLGWQTHFLNLVYTPQKAVSTVIAAEAMRQLPLRAEYGSYPANTRFGPVRVSYEENLSELITDSLYYHAGSTATPPPDPASIRRIAGFGSSPLVTYEGQGAYFLDQIAAGLWRLELYPDAVLVQDPYAQSLNYHSVSSRLIHRAWPMSIRLPDLGEQFHFRALADGSPHSTVSQAKVGTIEARPGIYLLSRESEIDWTSLPTAVADVPLRQFVCPPAPRLPPQAVHQPPSTVSAAHPQELSFELLADTLPSEAKLHIQALGSPERRSLALVRANGYRHQAALPKEYLTPATMVDYFVTAIIDGEEHRFPADGSWSTSIAGPRCPVPLITGETPPDRLSFTRVSEGNRPPVVAAVAQTEDSPQAIRLRFPHRANRGKADFTVGATVLENVQPRRPDLASASGFRMHLRGDLAACSLAVKLIETDGTAWAAPIAAAAEWSEVSIPLTEFKLSRAAILPQAYPGEWNYWMGPAAGRGQAGDHLDPSKIERIQFSFRPLNREAPASDPWIELTAAELILDQ
jgi:hypothetical protein